MKEVPSGSIVRDRSQATASGDQRVQAVPEDWFSGLFIRLAALGMIGFVVVQSYMDVAFHGVDGTTIGAWFDRLTDAIMGLWPVLWVFHWTIW